MNLFYSSNSKYRDKIEKLYLKSFPKEERFPFWILDKCSKEENSDLYAILDNEKFIGMCYIVNCKDVYYLMYFTVEPNLRNKKYGSRILNDLKEKYNTIFLSVDMPIDEISIRRKNFYLRNGFYDTNKYYEDTGISYSVLCSNNKYEITDNIMQRRYTNMTNNPKLFNVISTIFNVSAISLKEKL